MVILKLKWLEFYLLYQKELPETAKINISSWEEEQEDSVKKNISVTYANNMEKVLLHAGLKHQFYYLCRPL